MRGGALPLLAWGLLLVVLMSINWIWTNDTIQIASLGCAASVVFLTAVLLIVGSRGDAARRGAPPVTGEPQAIPTTSLGAVLVALALASLVFGLAFGRFLVYFGAGLLVASLGLVARELRDERRARRAGGAWREPRTWRERA